MIAPRISSFSWIAPCSDALITDPSAIAFTRIRCGASATAIDRVIWIQEVTFQEGIVTKRDKETVSAFLRSRDAKSTFGGAFRDASDLS